jgi:ribonucleoside-diphosphate reductase alpha chain
LLKLKELKITEEYKGFMDKVATKEQTGAQSAETQKYAFEEAFAATKDYFFGDELAANVWCDKYAMRDKEGLFLEKTPDAMHDRLAAEFARIDSEKYSFNYDERYLIYRDAVDRFGRIVPQGSPMAAVGNTQQIMSASNCVVVEPPHDSIAGIMKTGAELAQLYKRRCGVGTDLSGLRPDGFHVNNAARTTSGAWSFADYYSYITRMIGQCLHEDTQVLTRKGLKKIKTITVTDEVWTKNGWIKVSGVIENRKPCVKVTTKFGHEIVCSEDHVFHTINGEKPVKDLTVGDPITQIVGENGWEGRVVRLANPTYQKDSYNNSNRLNENIHVPSELTPKFAYVLGHMYGDGYVSKAKPSQEIRESGVVIALSPDWPQITEKLGRYIKDVFNYEAKPMPGDGCERYRIYSKILTQYLKANGLLKQKAHELVFPNQLFKADPSIACSFIAGFLDADGDIQISKKGYRIRSVCKDILLNMKNILAAIGIPTNVFREIRNTKAGQENWRDIHYLTINGMKAQHRFYDVMSESIKIRSHDKFVKKTNKLRTCYQTSDFETRASKHTYIIDDRQWISYSTTDRLKRDLNSTLDVRLLQDEIACIESYESSKLQAVFDLILPAEHLFFANGLYAHNSGRRGALMLTLNVHHPDVEMFARMKADLKKVTAANVSIRLSDEFLQAVEDDTTYEQRWPCEEGDTPVWAKQVDARQVWNTIIETATATAEPGLMFWDRCTKRLPAHAYPQFKSKSSNPCSEIILSSYDSCRLISLNLTGFVRDAFTKKAKFDLESFKNDVRLTMQMIDNLIDIELELIEKIQSVCSTDDELELWQKLWQAGHDGRRTGLGTHGLGDTLAQIGIKYDSQEALEFADRLYETLRDTSYAASIDLAEIRGPFPAFDWDTEKDNEYIRDLPEPIRNRMAKVGRRNISILTQAPTGSVSIVSKCGEFNRHNISSGVEPVFRNHFTRRKKINVGDLHTRADHTDDMGDNWQNFEVYHGNILNYFEKTHGVDLTDLTDSDTQETLAELMKELPKQFVTSDQVDWKFRVDLQGHEQHFIDHSISSTINLPKGTTSDVVGGIYLAGWRAGLKGVTVYVDGSRDGVLITEEDDRIDPNVRPDKIIRLQSPKRPKELPCDIHQHTVRGEKWTALVGLLDGDPYEMFGGYSNAIHLPKKYKEGTLKRRARSKYDLIIPVGDEELVIRDVVGTFNDDEIGWTTRLMSTALRHGAPIEFLTEQLSKDGGIQSFNRVLARVLKKYIPDGEKVKTNIACGNALIDKCDSPDLIYQGGCVSCAGCGWAKC